MMVKLRARYLLLLLFALVLAACGGEEEPAGEAAPGDETNGVSAPTQEPAATLPPPEISVDQVTPPDGTVPDETSNQTDQPSASPELPWPWPADAFGYGTQSHVLVGDPAYAMEVVRNQLGLEWIKIQFEWDLFDTQPDIYDGAMAEADKQGLRVMLSIVGAPAHTRARGNVHGPPDNFDLFPQFLTQVLTRYPGQIHAIEVWNEQNLDREWDTDAGISPENYVDLLSRAYAAIKAQDANIIVISGALSPTGPGDWVRWADDFEYMDRALAAGMLQYADCVGAHHNGYNIPPDIPFDQTGSLPEAGTAFYRGPFDNPNHSWSFKTTIDTYAQKVQAIDPAKKLCVTEFGWASSEGYDEYPTDFEFALDNTLDEQAQYIVQAFQQMRNSGDVWLAFVFNFDFGNKGRGPTDDPVPFSIIDTNGAPRPAFSAVSAMEKVR